MQDLIDISMVRSLYLMFTRTTLLERFNPNINTRKSTLGYRYMMMKITTTMKRERNNTTHVDNETWSCVRNVNFITHSLTHMIGRSYKIYIRQVRT